MIRTTILAAIGLIAMPAWAQLEPLPRFEGLEMQLQREEQRQIDQLQQERQRNLERGTIPGANRADSSLRAIELQREVDRNLLAGQVERQRVQRERDSAAMSLQSTRVPAHSSAVVRNPEAYILPPAPPGKYYARVDGRFVLVDATSELVESVLPVQITDPTVDVPAGPRPMPDTSLPVRRVLATSSLVISNYTSLSLPPPPRGQYYAQVEGKIVLVEARTELPVTVVRPG